MNFVIKRILFPPVLHPFLYTIHRMKSCEVKIQSKRQYEQTFMKNSENKIRKLQAYVGSINVQTFEYRDTLTP